MTDGASRRIPLFNRPFANRFREIGKTMMDEDFYSMNRQATIERKTAETGSSGWETKSRRSFYSQVES